MKIKVTCSPSGKDKSPEKIDKNQEEKVSVQVSKTSDVPGWQESSLLIPQGTQAQSESLSSEESTYYSCEDADDCGDDISLTKEQKYRFFQILKGLLEESGSLEYGKARKVQHGGKILKLRYMTERCEIIVQDLHGQLQFKEMVSTQDIYLRWHGDETAEPLSIKNLQNVSNEMRNLGILGEKMDACFKTTIHNFIGEPAAVKANATLNVSTTECCLEFFSGKGENEITVIYDDIVKKPRYHVQTADWCTAFKRILSSVWHTGCELISSLINSISSFLIEHILTSLKDWIVHLFTRKQKDKAVSV